MASKSLLKSRAIDFPTLKFFSDGVEGEFGHSDDLQKVLTLLDYIYF